MIGMCADFQDPPEMIGQFVSRWREGALIVLAQRRSEKSSWSTRIARDLGYAFLNRFGDYPVIPGATGFGLYDRKVVDELARWREPEPFFRGMLVESGFKCALIPFDRPERMAGESKNNFAELFSFALSGLAASSKSLLRLPIILSAYAAALAVLLMIGTLAALALDGPALAVLAFAVAFGIFAVLLLILGLLGEQVRMLAERSRDVPLVIEEERRLGFKPKRPQQDAGIRMDPPPSVACAMGRTPAETAAAAPPDDPPGV